MIETQPSAVSALIEEKAIEGLPLNGRRFTDLALLAPGVTTDPRGLTSSSNGDLAFGACADTNPAISSTVRTTTTVSFHKPVDDIALPTSSATRWCRSFVFPQ